MSKARLWFTGLSGSGKSTIANALDLRLFERGYHTFLLDGDNVRHGLNKDLGFSDNDRIENIRRIGEVSKLFTDAGLIVLSAFISPFTRDRRLVRNLFPAGEFADAVYGSFCAGHYPGIRRSGVDGGPGVLADYWHSWPC